jgi:hypothetical protein
VPAYIEPAIVNEEEIEVAKEEMVVDNKKREYELRKNNKHKNKVGLTFSKDSGWQKRSSGCTYNSASSHNFMVSCLSGSILGLVAYSKRCIVCGNRERKIKETKTDVPLVTHQCPRNFPSTDSSKSRESRAAVLHRCNLCRRKDIQAYVSKLVMDNDSTTRANLEHSWEEMFNEINDKGNWGEGDCMAT